MKFHHGVWAAADGWGRTALVLLFIAAIVQTLFVVEYASRPWRRLRVGRALMLKSSSLLLILWLTLFNTWFTYPWQEAVSAFALAFIAGAICYQTFVLYRTPLISLKTYEDLQHAEELPPS